MKSNLQKFIMYVFRWLNIRPSTALYSSRPTIECTSHWVNDIKLEFFLTTAKISMTLRVCKFRIDRSHCMLMSVIGVKSNWVQYDMPA